MNTHYTFFIDSEESAKPVDLTELFNDGRSDEFVQKISVDIVNGTHTIFEREEIEDELRELRNNWENEEAYDARKEHGTY